MKDALQWLADFVEQMSAQFWKFLLGIVGGLVALILPIKDVVTLLTWCFIFDSYFGYRAAKKLKGERFLVSKVWNITIPRMIFSIILIRLCYSWDTIYAEQLFNSYKIVAGFLSILLIISIAQNMYKITKWSFFKSIIDCLETQFKNKTGLNIKNNGKPKTQT